ncbi:class I SAM-dependent methyltransferase [Roseateles toxinivorans]|nr:methyltransferase domain-containing protein [Roseateles toxinivorans]
MAGNPSIIELAHWLQTPAGRYMLAWEQAQLDAAVVDLFGFHALQLGLPELDGLRSNRMPHRWLALQQAQPLPDDLVQDPARTVALHCDFDALPFDTNSLDLVVLPHALELACDPHQTLREVDRVLRPEGRVVILGLNPTSLWALRQRLGRLRGRLPGHKGEQGLFLPSSGEFIGYWRLRDWLRLLSFEVEGAHFGCYRPPGLSERWMQRHAWMEGAGERWWPVLGAVYFLVAVKRVRGMRLVGLLPQARKVAKTAAVAMHNNKEIS